MLKQLSWALLFPGALFRISNTVESDDLGCLIQGFRGRLVATAFEMGPSKSSVGAGSVQARPFLMLLLADETATPPRASQSPLPLDLPLPDICSSDIAT
jgi:hypothetical protein